MFRGFNHAHQAFDKRPDAVDAVPRHLIVKEIEALVFIKQQERITPPMLTRLLLAKRYLRVFRGRDQPAETRTQIGSNKHPKGCGGLPRPDASEGMYTAASIAEREIVVW